LPTFRTQFLKLGSAIHVCDLCVGRQLEVAPPSLISASNISASNRCPTLDHHIAPAPTRVGPWPHPEE
jgi:hypothetical protein